MEVYVFTLNVVNVVLIFQSLINYVYLRVHVNGLSQDEIIATFVRKAGGLILLMVSGFQAVDRIGHFCIGDGLVNHFLLQGDRSASLIITLCFLFGLFFVEALYLPMFV